MKILIPFITLFLASCGVHNSRYDARQDVYYQDDYYANDNYDPYYGYGSSGYSSAGDGVFYNDYNYYPDRWGVSYSSVNYTPYRYPRVGFYFSSGYGCGYSYWSNGCSSRYYPTSYYTYNAWPSYGFGFSYSSYYYDNNWWYNHWRHRNYEHYRPTQTGYYSARNEATRLNNNRYYTSYKNNQRNNSYNNSSRNNPPVVNRNRSSSNRPVNNNSRSRNNIPSRSAKPTQRDRGREDAAVQNNNQRYNQNSNNHSVRSQVINRSNSGQTTQQRVVDDYSRRNITSNRYQTQKPGQTVTKQPNQLNRTNRVKPMNSQSPVYQTNTAPRLSNRSNTVQYNQRNLNNPNQVVPRTGQRQQNVPAGQRIQQSTNYRGPQSSQAGPRQSQSYSQPVVKPSPPNDNNKPSSTSKSVNKSRDNRSNDNKSTSSKSRKRSVNRD